MGYLEDILIGSARLHDGQNMTPEARKSYHMRLGLSHSGTTDVNEQVRCEIMQNLCCQSSRFPVTRSIAAAIVLVVIDVLLRQKKGYLQKDH